MATPSYREELSSQIPALQLLINMGYEYLPPSDVLRVRRGKLGNVLLEEVLEHWLREHNWINFRGQDHEFSDANIQQAINALKHEPYDGLIRTSEKLYELLTLGTSLTQTIDGDKKSFSLHYIDWQYPENNVYHVVDEYSVERPRQPNQTRRPDIVVFVNGIPLVVMECKRPDLQSTNGKPSEEAISQMLRNQHDDEIPNLFVFSQLLLAISMNEAQYATTGTAQKFWALWQEEEDIEAKVHALINQPLSDAQQVDLYDHRKYAGSIRYEFATKGERQPTVQDRTLYSLLKPERLLHLIYQFIVYDGGVKKIARYQQYFAIHATINRVVGINHQGTRTGGVIWHTTGSGKSLTMVMLAKALTLHPNIPNPRVVLVTDRINLDDQIWKTFNACGKQAVKANSGAHLMELIRSTKADIITTIIDKFDTVERGKLTDENINVFVLVDESHRGQYGTIHAKMRQVFKNACYIGFTGTPILKQDKETVRKFGDFIHKYTMRQAVADKAVVPLLYEGRIVDLDVDRDQIDRWFERVTARLNEDQRQDLKLKFSRNEEVSQAEQRLKEIAFDISQHYSENFKGDGFKAQLATSSKAVAMKYKQYLDEFGMVSSEVVISSPDTREGHEEIDNFSTTPEETFWKRMMKRYGSEDAYNREILKDFHEHDGLEMLIVVDKLLVGFDEPRNTVLYIDKSLKEHSLLQAIARVNRLFEGKEFGYIIDYRGVLGHLNEAMQTYEALEEFDPEDVAGTVTDVSGEIDKLPQLHSDLWDIFKTVDNQRDQEALETFLAPEDIRQQFYEALTAYARSLKVALGTVQFYEDTPEKRINTYKRDLHFFHNLRMSVKQRYAEAIDYKEYEAKVRKLMDEHIKAGGVSKITELVNIFDAEKFDAEVARLGTAASQADTIAHRLKRTITEKMEENPAFYQKFSRLIDDTIQAYRDGRISEAEYLDQMRAALDAVRDGQDAGLPTKLSRYRHAAAYYGVLEEPILQQNGVQPEELAEVAIEIERIIEDKKIRDWIHNTDIQNQMRNEVEDHLLDAGIAVSGNALDLMIDQLIDVARNRDHL